MQEIVEIKDEVLSSLVRKYISRSNAGIKKYGTTLEENDKDDFLNHLQEELMDASLYVEKLKKQKRSKELEQISEALLKIHINELREENIKLRKQLKDLKAKHKSNSYKAFKNYIKPIQYLQYAYKIGNEKYFSQAIAKLLISTPELTFKFQIRMKGVDDVIENIQPFQTYSACLAQAIKDVQENMNL